MNIDNSHTLLFPYAYNILGSSEDAKDAIQDVLSKFIQSEKTDIRDEKNYLIRSVINRSIDIKNSRKKIKREGDVWLPEPLATEEADTNINMKEIISYSLLVLLEQLNPKERAVFILREGFDYSHEEIAEVLSSTVEHSRKLLSRAKNKLELSGEPVSTEKVSEGFLDRYIDAIRGRDTGKLEGLLTRDIAYFADGGGQIKLTKSTSLGSKDVAELLINNYQQFQTTQSVVTAEINHQPALLYYQGTRLVACQVFGISRDGKISSINTILDPEKLKHIG
jgi:RNA polymerase sigma factor (sigma-70 family)